MARSVQFDGDLLVMAPSAHGPSAAARMVVLEVMRPPRSAELVINIDAGTVLPLPTTALGLAYIVAAAVQEQTQILDGLSRRHQADWPQMRQSIERAHREYARHGYVLTQRSWGRDVNGVAVPLVLAASKVSRDPA